MHPVLRALLIAAGLLSLAFAVIGAFLPILPTVPFLLLSAAAFARSSTRLHDWLLNRSWFGRSIRDYLKKRGIRLRTKILVIASLWVSIGISVLFLSLLLAVKILLVAVAAGVTWHIASFKTLSNRDPPDPV
jgi:uncharacterized membrane protein YbaN (DUF454 family)